jgi:hypothetical protein
MVNRRAYSGGLYINLARHPGLPVAPPVKEADYAARNGPVCDSQRPPTSLRKRVWTAEVYNREGCGVGLSDIAAGVDRKSAERKFAQRVQLYPRMWVGLRWTIIGYSEEC